MTHPPGRFTGLIRKSRKITGSLIKHPVLLTSLVIVGFILGVRQIGGLQSWELLTYDQMIRLRPDEEPDPRLLLVTVTEEDIRQQNQWPMSDAVLAKLLQKLQQRSSV